MIRTRLGAISVVLLTLVGLTWALAASWASGSPAMAVSVSSDGRYVVSSHQDGRLYVWDLDQRDRTLITEQANIYSAYFVPNRHAFMWQELDRTVRVQDPSGEVLTSFSVAHDTYGHLISRDLETYVSTDDGWGIHIGHGAGMQTLKAHNPGNFRGFGKPFNLSVSESRLLLLSAGDGAPSYGASEYFSFERQREIGFKQFDGVTLWSLETLEPIAKLPGNTAKTHATLSPDGQWVVSGDENGIGLYWNTNKPDMRYRMASYFHGLFLGTHEAGDPRNRDRSGLIPVPDGVTETTVAVKFIHESRYYLRFGYNSHYAALFEVDNPWPLKYLDLGTRPFPATDQFSRNLAIDTAPEAGVLVMGQRDGPGILVYQFDPEALTLERVWVGK